MSGPSGLAKYGTYSFDYQTPHILRKPYESVMAPRSERVSTEDVSHEVQDSGEYMSDNFRAIPTGVNPAASIGFGHGPMQNSGIKRVRKGKLKGYAGQEPLYHPESGTVHHPEDAKVPEEFYADNRRPTRYVELPENIQHTEDPMIMFPRTGSQRFTEKHIVPVSVTPSVVYEVDNKPNIGEWAYSLSKRGHVNLTPNFNPIYETGVLPNPTRAEKYINNNRIITSILPPVFSTFIKIADKKIKLRHKDPHYFALQASESAELNIPFPNGQSFKIRDYQWNVVQGHDANYEFVIEVPVQLQNRPDLAVSIQALENVYGSTRVDKNSDGRITDRRLTMSQTAPALDTTTNQYVAPGEMYNELRPSKVYQSVDNAFDAIPRMNGDMDTRLGSSRIKANRIYVQPEPDRNAPWF